VLVLGKKILFTDKERKSKSLKKKRVKDLKKSFSRIKERSKGIVEKDVRKFSNVKFRPKGLLRPIPKNEVEHHLHYSNWYPVYENIVNRRKEPFECL